jgi:HEAT repeat protein
MRSIGRGVALAVAAVAAVVWSLRDPALDDGVSSVRGEKEPAPSPSPILAAPTQIRDARESAVIASAVGAPGEASGSLVVPPGPGARARLLGEIRRGLELVDQGDPASWKKGTQMVKMAMLGARSADPELMTLLRAEVLAALMPGLADRRALSDHPRDDVRGAVVDAFDTWDWDGSILGPKLRGAYETAPPALRAGLLDALGAIDPGALPDRDVLAAAAASPDEDLARAGLAALARVPELLGSRDAELAGRHLHASSPRTREEALGVLAAVKQAPTGGTDELVRLWDDPDEHVRSQARAALRAVDPDLAVRVAQERLRSPEARVRSEAMWGLTGLTAEHMAPVVDDVLAGLRDPDASVRAATANALGYMPSLASRSVPALREAVAEGGHVAYEALASLARLDFVAATPLLVAALSDRDGMIRYVAAVKLGEHGGVAYAGGIIRLAEDPERQVRHAVTRYLLGNPGALYPVDDLVRALERGHPDTRVAVIQALGGMRGHAAAALPALERLASDPTTGSVARSAIERIRGG